MLMKRMHTCGELTPEHSGKETVLNGWVASRRDLGGLIFIDLRDRYGLTQVVFDESDENLHGKAEQLRTEFVVGIKGIVKERSEGNVNPELPTGAIEVAANELFTRKPKQRLLRLKKISLPAMKSA